MERPAMDGHVVRDLARCMRQKRIFLGAACRCIVMQAAAVVAVQLPVEGSAVDDSLEGAQTPAAGSARR